MIATCRVNALKLPRCEYRLQDGGKMLFQQTQLVLMLKDIVGCVATVFSTLRETLPAVWRSLAEKRIMSTAQ